MYVALVSKLGKLSFLEMNLNFFYFFSISSACNRFATSGEAKVSPTLACTLFRLDFEFLSAS